MPAIDPNQRKRSSLPLGVTTGPVGTYTPGAPPLISRSAPNPRVPTRVDLPPLPAFLGPAPPSTGRYIQSNVGRNRQPTLGPPAGASGISVVHDAQARPMATPAVSPTPTAWTPGVPGVIPAPGPLGGPGGIPLGPGPLTQPRGPIGGPQGPGFQPTTPMNAATVNNFAPWQQTGAPPAPLATPSGGFDTALSPAEEQQFQTWKTKYAPHDSGYDYDLRGAFKEGMTPAVGGPNPGHFDDKYKKPWHPTFSTQSKYAEHGNPGTWGGPGGQTYIPGTKPGIAGPNQNGPGAGSASLPALSQREIDNPIRFQDAQGNWQTQERGPAVSFTGTGGGQGRVIGRSPDGSEIHANAPGNEAISRWGELPPGNVIRREGTGETRSYTPEGLAKQYGTDPYTVPQAAALSAQRVASMDTQTAKLQERRMAKEAGFEGDIAGYREDQANRQLKAQAKALGIRGTPAAAGLSRPSGRGIARSPAPLSFDQFKAQRALELGAGYAPSASDPMIFGQKPVTSVLPKYAVNPTYTEGVRSGGSLYDTSTGLPPPGLQQQPQQLQVPPDHIAMLQANQTPEMVAHFEEIYGPGSAAQYLKK